MLDPFLSDDSDVFSCVSNSDSLASSLASDYDSVSSDTSSESSIDKRCTSSHKDKKKKKYQRKSKSKPKPKPKPRSNFHKYQNHDPSTEDPKRAFGMSIGRRNGDQ